MALAERFFSATVRVIPVVGPLAPEGRNLSVEWAKFL
jgi:hypothetical protein